MYRALILLSLAVFVVTPAVDQVACAHCGPSTETSATVKAVPHSEDDCILNDGFERPAQSPDEESTHIHFCLLHATSIALNSDFALNFHPETGELVLTLEYVLNPYFPPFFHPPTKSRLL